MSEASTATLYSLAIKLTLASVVDGANDEPDFASTPNTVANFVAISISANTARLRIIGFVFVTVNGKRRMVKTYTPSHNYDPSIYEPVSICDTLPSMTGMPLSVIGTEVQSAGITNSPCV